MTQDRSPDRHPPDDNEHSWHEIRTSLTVIMLQAEVLRRAAAAGRPLTGECLTAAADRLQHHADKIEHAVRDL